MHKSRRVHNRLRSMRAKTGKMFVRQDLFPPEPGLSASNENHAVSADYIPPDPTDPSPSPGVRVPTTKGARTARGYTIFKNCVVHHESELEHRTSIRIQSRNDVKILISQPYKVRFIDENGDVTHHIFDYHIEYVDGLRVAVAVKPCEKVGVLAALLGCLLESGKLVREDGTLGSLDEAFDRITIIDENWASLDEYHNAKAVLWALKKPREQACPIVWQRALSLRSTKLRYIDLISGLPDNAARHIAFWLLVHAGVLTPVEEGRIDDLTWMVVNGGNVAAAA
jgi:hypothetical protein